jgi:hypothetical protein
MYIYIYIYVYIVIYLERDAAGVVVVEQREGLLDLLLGVPAGVPLRHWWWRVCVCWGEGCANGAKGAKREKTEVGWLEKRRFNVQSSEVV